MRFSSVSELAITIDFRDKAFVVLRNIGDIHNHFGLIVYADIERLSVYLIE